MFGGDVLGDGNVLAELNAARSMRRLGVALCTSLRLAHSMRPDPQPAPRTVFTHQNNTHGECHASAGLSLL
jgi:hypothetical protein